MEMRGQGRCYAQKRVYVRVVPRCPMGEQPAIMSLFKETKRKYAMVVGFGISLAIGGLSASASYAMYRKKSVAFWAFIAALLPDVPSLVLPSFGVTNLDNLLLFTHTVGIFVLPLILVIADIVLIEFSLLRYLAPFNRILYPKSLRLAIRLEKIIERLQHYYALPRPVRIQRLYLVGLLAGTLQLLTYLLFGIL